MKVRLDKKIKFKKSQKKHNQILLLTILTIFFITIYINSPFVWLALDWADIIGGDLV